MRNIVNQLIGTYPEGDIGHRLSEEISRVGSNRHLVHQVMPGKDVLGKDIEIAITYFTYNGRQYAFWAGTLQFMGLYEINIHNGTNPLSSIWLTMHPLLKGTNYQVWLDVYFEPAIKANSPVRLPGY